MVWDIAKMRIRLAVVLLFGTVAAAAEAANDPLKPVMIAGG